MNRALAIETSGRIGSVALVERGKAVVEEQFPHGLKHAAEILPAIDRMCRALGWRPVDIREIYVSAGPGSFTGLRIGITLAKTLAFALEARIVAVPSARVLVENAPVEASSVIVVLDAKREQIFTARFERAAAEWREVEPAHLDSLTAILARSPRPVHLLGEGIPYHENFVPPGDGVVLTSVDSWRGRASVVAGLGVAMARQGTFTDPFRLGPIYIRKPEAEEKYDALNQRS